MCICAHEYTKTTQQLRHINTHTHMHAHSLTNKPHTHTHTHTHTHNQYQHTHTHLRCKRQTANPDSQRVSSLDMVVIHKEGHHFFQVKPGCPLLVLGQVLGEHLGKHFWSMKQHARWRKTLAFTLHRKLFVSTNLPDGAPTCSGQAHAPQVHGHSGFWLSPIFLCSHLPLLIKLFALWKCS